MTEGRKISALHWFGYFLLSQVQNLGIYLSKMLLICIKISTVNSWLWELTLSVLSK